MIADGLPFSISFGHGLDSVVSEALAAFAERVRIAEVVRADLDNYVVSCLDSCRSVVGVKVRNGGDLHIGIVVFDIVGDLIKEPYPVTGSSTVEFFHSLTTVAFAAAVLP